MMIPRKRLLGLAFSLLIPFLSYGQNKTNADTTYFALQTKMIKKATIQKVKWEKTTRYRIFVQLKNQYYKQYEQATARSIGKRFAITYHGHILSPILPTVNTKINHGRFTIEPFKKRKQARKIMSRIVGKD